MLKDGQIFMANSSIGIASKFIAQDIGGDTFIIGIKGYEIGPRVPGAPSLRYDYSHLGARIEGTILKVAPLAALVLLASIAVVKSPRKIDPDGIFAHLFPGTPEGWKNDLQPENCRPLDHMARLALYDVNYPRNASADRKIRQEAIRYLPMPHEWPYAGPVH